MTFADCRVTVLLILSYTDMILLHAGTVPYAGVDSGMDILNEIKRGYRLEQPADCDDEV